MIVNRFTPVLLALVLIVFPPPSVPVEPSTLNTARENAPNWTDQLIVKWRTHTLDPSAQTPTQRQSILSDRAALGIEFVRQLGHGIEVFRLPNPMLLEDVRTLAATLATTPGVEYVEPDRIARAALVPNDTRYSEQWHLHPPASAAGSANLEGAWDITTGNTSVAVAVIDTGLRPHADIDTNITNNSGRVVPGYDFISNAFVANDGNARDGNPSDPGDWLNPNECAPGNPSFFTPSSWHGTHVMGTVGANGNNALGVAGINWGAKLIAARVLGKCGGFESDIIDALRWSAGLVVPGVPNNANPARVINLSLSGPGSCSVSFQSAVTEVVAAGSVVVVAAGNDNADLAFSPVFPATCSGVITVAAVNRAGGRAWYSNFGTTVEIAAPGGDTRFLLGDGVLSTLNTGTTSPGGDTYQFYQGTSMASPHVAGIASLMLTADPTLTPASVLSNLQGNARTFPTGTGSDCTGTTCGSGIVDGAAAVGRVSRLLSVDKTSLAFPDTDVGQSAAAQTVTVKNTNTGSISLTLDSVSITGTDSSHFTLGGSCNNGTVLAPQATCTASIQFAPAAIGSRAASFSVQSSSAANSPINVPLSGASNGPVITISATDPDAAEAGLDPGEITISRTGNTASVLSVGVTISGSATPGSDYNALSSPIDILSGQASVAVAVTPIDDTDKESNETVVVTLGATTLYVVGSPDSATVTIVSDEKPSGGGGGGGCFIATAAYGTPMASDVRYLRALRDKYLLTNTLGSGLVDLYYRYSPTAAEVLRGHDGWRAYVRQLLQPAVVISRYLIDSSEAARQTADRP